MTLCGRLGNPNPMKTKANNTLISEGVGVAGTRSATLCELDPIIVYGTSAGSEVNCSWYLVLPYSSTWNKNCSSALTTVIPITCINIQRDLRDVNSYEGDDSNGPRDEANTGVPVAYSTNAEPEVNCSWYLVLPYSSTRNKPAAAP